MECIMIAPPRHQHASGAAAMLMCAAAAINSGLAAEGDVFVPPPIPLNSNARYDMIEDDGVRLFRDDTGHLLALWKDHHGESGNDKALLAAGSDDQGGTWSDTVCVYEDDSLDHWIELSQVEALGAGAWYVEWALGTYAEEEDPHYPHKSAQTLDNGKTWSEPEEPPQQLHLHVWTETGDKDGPFCDDGDIFVSRSLDEQPTRSDPTPVNNDAATDRCSGVIGEGWSDADRGPSMFYVSGVWIVVWERQKLDSSGQDTGADRLLAATSRDDGKTWSGPSEVPRPRLWEGGPRLQPDPPSQRPSVPIQFQAATPDRWHMLWWGSVDPSVDHDEGGLTASVTTDAGASWSSTLVFTDHGTDYRMPRDRYPGPTQFFEPTLTIGTSDDLLVTWLMGRYVDDQFPDSYHLFAARSADRGRTWSEPVQISTDAASGPTWGGPSVSGDGGGEYVVVWRSVGDPNSATGVGRILVAFSDDKGATWTDPTPLNPDAASDSVDDKPDAVISLGPGQWLVAWSGSLGGDYGADKDILLTRLAYPDCNQNGLPDDVELADGTAADANGNGVPDECDPGPEPNNPPDEDQPSDDGDDGQPGDADQPSDEGPDGQQGEDATPQEPGPALPCGIFPLVGAALFLLVRSARTARGSPLRP
jgi:hypothetical protein